MSSQPEEWFTLVLKPLLVVVFVVLHTVYHVVRVCHSGWRRVVTAGGPEELLDCSTTWPAVLKQHELDQASVTVPKHLAMVLAETSPSSVRLALTALVYGRRRKAAWSQLKEARTQSVQRKNAHDTATLIHLARLSGVRQLTVYTRAPFSSISHLQQSLLDRFNTRAITASSHSSYTSKRIASPSSSAHSSDTEASLSSTEISAASTLASSYTLDMPTIDLRIGRSSSSSNLKHTFDTTSQLQVTLLCEADADAGTFAQIVSNYAKQIGSDYLDSTLKPDMASSRSSGNSLRRQWMATRASKISDLTTAELNTYLLDHGYPAEPELLIVYGGDGDCRQLHGMPAWSMRLTDMFFDAFMQSHLAYSTRDYVAALHKHSSSQQRYGR